MFLFLGALQLVCSLLVVSCDIDLEKKTLINGLDGLINFLNYDSENVNADGLLGIVINEAQLILILENLSETDEFYEKILQLKEKSFDLIKKIKSKINIFNGMEYYSIFENIMQPQVWQQNKPFIKNSLKNLNTYNWKNLSEQVLFDNILFSGHPNGLESDECINELLKFGNTNNFHECNPSYKCKNIMLNTENSHGYPLTHKLSVI